MSAKTEISWTDATFNPWWGCTNVSPACDHCYAETFSRRVGFSETGSKFPIWGKDTARRFFGDAHWAEPLKWNRAAEKVGVRKRVFCGSMCDVMEDYGRQGLDGARQMLYELIERTPWLDWLLLTKRPQNFCRFLPKAWLESPRPNVWGMTTVESAEYLWRAKALLETPFAIRGLSVEPLLGSLDLSELFRWSPRKCVDWVIVGGESGPGARPMHPQWARSIRDQCIAAGVKFHFKQWGEWRNRLAGDPDTGRMIRLTAMGRNGQDLANAEDGGDVWMQRVGKKAAGRLLDGREWNEFPVVRP